MTDQAQTDDLAAQLRRLQADLDAIKETLKQAGKREAHSAMHDAKSAMSNAEAYVRANPNAVIAGAVGVGVLLGLLLRRH
ncbi:hypothetical protein ASD45_15485 [Pseudolabrys sp. Root1462]|jgi:ElaB/YqjD/DUF883 family membrane-anchored ribosome-binding protein|uniref:glycine zipper domain-containing protein n=1 Tax=Pseudolabrys sp. Root1462 TaxID=1736466 RepID=UPI0007030FFF|nr:DUF883 family protein [Pseudolabrys sp. Root1462]KQZ02103.1 hypothetical protein ASD45_15485 [Pseudolabrys sp. Root1462]